MGTNPLDLYALAQELLDACVDALDTIPDSDPLLSGAPTRRFVSPGQPADDCCDQLTVRVSRIGDADTTPGGLGASKRIPIGKQNHVVFIVRSTRCIPTGVDPKGGYSAPEPEELDASSQQLYADAWALWNHIYNLLRAGELLTLCSKVFFDGLTETPPLGGCGGWDMIIRVALDGYEETFGS
jgi:hypothetical protein